MILGFEIYHAIRNGRLFLLSLLACLPHANVDHFIVAARVVPLDVQLVVLTLVKLPRKVAEVILRNLVCKNKLQEPEEPAF